MFPSNPFFASYVFLPLLILYFFTLPAFPPSSVRFPIPISQPAPLFQSLIRLLSSNLSTKALLPISRFIPLFYSLSNNPSVYPPSLLSAFFYGWL